MKKIIALYAAANRGKTTVLNKLINLLSNVAEYYDHAVLTKVGLVLKSKD